MIWHLRYFEDRRSQYQLPPSKLRQLIEKRDKDFIIRREALEGFLKNLQIMFPKAKETTRDHKNPQIQKPKCQTISDFIGETPLIPHSGVLAFPSHEAMSSSSKRGGEPIPFMLSPKGDQKVKIFSSKEKPFRIAFPCTDGLTRQLIFKNSANENIDSFLPRYFINQLRQAVFEEQLINKFPEVHKDAVLVHNVLPLCSRTLAIESIPASRCYQEYMSQGQEQPVEFSKQFYLTEVMGEFANDNYLEFFDFVQKVQISHAIWSAFGFFTGIGDRNLANIMIQETGRSFYIDYEIIMGIGNNLPCPEIVDIRLGFTFRSLFGPSEYEGLFFTTLAATLQHISQQADVISCLFYELQLHRQEKTFLDLNMRLNEPAITDFFRRKVEYIRDDAELAAEKLIERNNDKSRLDVMFPGWKPLF